MPIFVEYFHANDYDKKITMVAPADENSILQIAIVPYGASGLRLLLAQDITQLKKMERIRKDFVANVSHELRTPLTVLKGYLETLQDMEKVSPILMRSLQQMEAQTNRMQVLVDDLLMLTRLETRGKRTECVNVLDLLQSIVRETEAERIKLTIDTVSKLQGDPEELRSAFGNLIENALKYSAVETTIKVRWYKVKNYACFEVEDKGEGITKQEIPRITERFYRADVKRMNKIDGTGLGLAIVKHVLVRHEAKLQIYSEVDKGSCFQCIFPKRRLC